MNLFVIRFVSFLLSFSCLNIKILAEALVENPEKGPWKVDEMMLHIYKKEEQKKNLALRGKIKNKNKTKQKKNVKILLGVREMLHAHLQTFFISTSTVFM